MSCKNFRDNKKKLCFSRVSDSQILITILLQSIAIGFKFRLVCLLIVEGYILCESNGNVGRDIISWKLLTREAMCQLSGECLEVAA
jgi:hypothetical protein